MRIAAVALLMATIVGCANENRVSQEHSDGSGNSARVEAVLTVTPDGPDAIPQDLTDNEALDCVMMLQLPSDEENWAQLRELLRRNKVEYAIAGSRAKWLSVPRVQFDGTERLVRRWMDQTGVELLLHSADN